MATRFLTALVLTTLCWNPQASATEIWNCSYRAYGSFGDQIPAKYRVVGHIAREMNTAQDFRILENNQLALVASEGGAIPAAMAPEQGELIGTTSLLIKKSTGELVLGNVNLTSKGPVTETTFGKCRSVSK